MTASRNELKQALDDYVSLTFSSIEIVKNFVNKSSGWIKEREGEKSTLANFSERASDIRNRFSKVRKAKTTGTKFVAFWKFVGDSIVPGRTSKKQSEEEEELQKEMELLVQRILEGLNEMQIFLEAVEKLTVTSDHVFEQNQVVQLSEETDLESVRRILLAARIIGALLLLFKRNNEDFFKAKVHNVEVMEFQLNLYILTIKHICDAFRETSVADLCLNKPTFSLRPEVSEDDVEKMLSNINTLDLIRKNKHFRMVFLFHDEHRSFMEMFAERKERMLEVLDELEPRAIKLDRMKKGARISNVVGSSVGVVGGGLSIAGLALAPVTVGASLGLTIAGAVVAGTSGVNSIVTMTTDHYYSNKQKNDASENFKRFMKDVDDLQNCLRNIINNYFQSTENSDILRSLKMTGKGVSLAKTIDTIVDCISAVKLWNAEKAAVTAAGSGRAVGQAVSDVPELGQAALKGPLAMSTAARNSFIVVNSLFIGFDVFVIATEGANLSWGSETETSKWIRARAALWRSEVESLQTICDSLEEGQKLLKKKHVLQESFYGDVMDQTGQKNPAREKLLKGANICHGLFLRPDE